MITKRRFLRLAALSGALTAVAAVQAYLYRSAWYALFPGLAITLAVVGTNFFADGLQDALDPRRTRRGT